VVIGKGPYQGFHAWRQLDHSPVTLNRQHLAPDFHAGNELVQGEKRLVDDAGIAKTERVSRRVLINVYCDAWTNSHQLR
jgi:hypothetical protein